MHCIGWVSQCDRIAKRRETQVESGTARNGDVQIAYEDFGKPGGRPLLLISGLDDQMISSWPDGLCEALARAGLHVVRYDHRDAGLSTHFTGKKKAYELTAMIDDMMAVLDAMGWESANLAGLSMGGGLAQFAALLHPQRVRTLTAVSSIPMSGNKIQGAARYMRLFPGPFKLVFRRYGDSPQGKQRMTMDVIRLTEARSLPLDDEWVRQTAAEALRRHPPDRHARSRQLAAGYAAKLPDGGIARITQPVLVLSGDEDPIVKAPAAGQALARAVPHGRFVLVHRMGHLPSAPLWPELASEISQHAA
jgi:pimeloyl-ACP methyl ester carboxylesterase